jgi:hypothetical protein
MNGPNKPECLLLGSLSSVVNCLIIRPEPARVKHTSGAPFWGRLVALPTTLYKAGKAYQERALAYWSNL